MKKNMVKTLALAGMAVLTMGALAGCSSNTTESTAAPTTAQSEAEATTAGTSSAETTTAAPAASADLKGSISMVGSTSMEKFATALSEIFMEKYPNVVAIDGIAVVIDPANAVEDLTKDQLTSIYNGTITNWKDAGGADQPIVVIGRESGSGTRSAFEEILDVADACKYSNELDSTGAVMAKVASTPGSIGYVSLDVLDDTVKTLKLDGTEATADNIKAGTYFLSRPFVMATKGEISEQNDLVKALFDYIYSDEGTELVKSVGLIPTN